MPAPSTIEEFLELLRRSELVDQARLDAYLKRVQAAGAMPAHPKKLAGALVREGFLTFFQHDQLLEGKWRGFTIGKYHVMELLGAGGGGVVYLCRHRLMGHRVAIKVLARSLSDNPQALERFFREAQVVAALQHPNIVRAHDVDQDGPLHFLVMEYVEGSGLDRYVRKLGPLNFCWAAWCVRQAALGLQHAHEAGLVHRDIKPANLLVDRQGVVRLLDLGLARFFNEQPDDATPRNNQLLGTADYISPEQAINSDLVDIRSDIYSLGATFYFLLTAQPPFAEKNLAQKLIAHQMKEPAPIGKLRAGVPPALTDVVARMMAKDPARRYQVPREVLAALEPWTQPPIPNAPALEPAPLSPAARRSGPSAASASLAKAAAAAGSSGILQKARNTMPATPAPGASPPPASQPKPTDATGLFAD